MLRVTDWNTAHENNRTRELKRLDWVPVPNRFDGDGYTALVDHEDGASHLGAWVVILEVASRCDPRGTLIRSDGTPHSAVSLSRMSRLPVAVFEAAIPRLIKIGWLTEAPERKGNKRIPQDDAGIPQDDATLSQEGAGIPQDGAASRARERAPAHTPPRAPAQGREGNGREEKEDPGADASASGSVNDSPSAPPEPGPEATKVHHSQPPAPRSNPMRSAGQKTPGPVDGLLGLWDRVYSETMATAYVRTAIGKERAAASRMLAALLARPDPIPDEVLAEAMRRFHASDYWRGKGFAAFVENAAQFLAQKAPAAVIDISGFLEGVAP